MVGGRLQFAKHQIIISYNDSVIEKLILNVHVKASHAGPETTLPILHQRFWLPRGQHEVKQVLKKCLTCKHWNTQPCQQKMAPLPAERVMIAPPFINISLDFTGPNISGSKGSQRQLRQKHMYASSSVKLPMRSTWSC